MSASLFDTVRPAGTASETPRYDDAIPMTVEDFGDDSSDSCVEVYGSNPDESARLYSSVQVTESARECCYF